MKKSYQVFACDLFEHISVDVSIYASFLQMLQTSVCFYSGDVKTNPCSLCVCVQTNQISQMQLLFINYAQVSAVASTYQTWPVITNRFWLRHQVVRMRHAD